MEIGNNKYVFVIHKAKLNGKGHVVFKVSTKEIDLSEKKMLKLPHGHHDRVRFDIDSTTTVYCYGDGNNPGASFNYAICLDKANGNNKLQSCFYTCFNNHPITSSNPGFVNDGATPNPITNDYITCALNCLNYGVPN